MSKVYGERLRKARVDNIDCINLLAEIEHLRKDAARYQFIRAGGAYIEPHESGEIYLATHRGAYHKDPIEFDAAIDAAIEDEKSKDSV